MAKGENYFTIISRTYSNISREVSDELMTESRKILCFDPEQILEKRKQRAMVEGRIIPTACLRVMQVHPAVIIKPAVSHAR